MLPSAELMVRASLITLILGCRKCQGANTLLVQWLRTGTAPSPHGQQKYILVSVFSASVVCSASCSALFSLSLSLLWTVRFGSTESKLYVCIVYSIQLTQTVDTVRHDKVRYATDILALRPRDCRPWRIGLRKFY